MALLVLLTQQQILTSPSRNICILVHNNTVYAGRGKAELLLQM
jgi:hypothetical protein